MSGKVALSGEATCEMVLTVYKQSVAVQERERDLRQEWQAVVSGLDIRELAIRVEQQQRPAQPPQPPATQDVKEAVFHGHAAEVRLPLAVSPATGAQSLEAIKLPHIDPKGFPVALEPRIRAYEALKRAYVEFGALAKYDASAEIKAVTSALINSVNSLSNVPDMPSSVSGPLPNIMAAVVGAAQARDIKALHRAFADLIQQFRLLWQYDLVLWNRYLTDTEKDAAEIYETYKPGRYDRDLLMKASKMPYVFEIAVAMQMYKSQNEALKYFAPLKSSLNEVGDMLSRQRVAHAEMDKPEPLLDRIQFTLDIALGTLNSVKGNNK